MDTGILVKNSKSQKCDAEESVGESRNRIESLPENIFFHILSFLSTKDAVKTSVLSKRWQYLWTSVPNLDFTEVPSKRAIFMNFVERVLILRDFSTLQKFSLSCEVQFDASRISSWITGAVRRKVQEVDLTFDNMNESFVFPSSLFTCETLSVLRIVMGDTLQLPPHIYFPSLKKLSLLEVIFLDDESTQQLFSGCPLLEELTVYNCGWENLRAVTIATPRLQVLDISDNPDCETESSSCQVMIFAPDLKRFSYTGELLNDFCLCDSPSIDAHIGIAYYMDMEERHTEISYHAHKLLRAFAGVKRLSISDETLKILKGAKELLANLPKLDKLTHLVLDTHSSYFDCKGLLKMLQQIPYLLSLEFPRGFRLSADCDKDNWMLDPVPSCLRSHLEMIRVANFSGTKAELTVAKNLLKEALVLKTIVVNYHFIGTSGGLKELKTVQEQLLSFPRGSPCCEVILL